MKNRAYIMLAVLFLVTSVLFEGCAPKYVPYVPPPIKYTYQQGRPQIYDYSYIKRVAVLSFQIQEFTDYLTENLVGHSKWAVIDRATIDRIISEQNLQHSNRFDDTTAVMIGKIAGVDIVIFGENYTSRVVLKVIDVQTAKYLVYKNITIDASLNQEWNAMFTCQFLLPYAIRYRGGTPNSMWVGGKSDTIDVETATWK